LTAVYSTNVTVIVCGAPLATRTPDLLIELVAEGWTPSVIATPSALGWLDQAAIADAIGVPARSQYRDPSQPKSLDPAAVVVCPATFNTVNKAAAGAMDTYALGVFCEALGAGIPTIVVPMVNNKLWGHPAWQRSLSVLVEAGAALVDVQTGGLELTPVTSGSGDAVVEAFDPSWVTARLEPPR
jgi:phosphopantothenoylcysteine synthetase/decarboxylase